VNAALRGQQDHQAFRAPQVLPEPAAHKVSKESKDCEVPSVRWGLKDQQVKLERRDLRAKQEQPVLQVHRASRGKPDRKGLKVQLEQREPKGRREKPAQ